MKDLEGVLQQHYQLEGRRLRRHNTYATIALERLAGDGEI
jgi:hypothetical protein